MENIIEKDGKKYVKLGDKALEIASFDVNGKPIIKVESEEISYPDGRQDVIIKVPYLGITSKNN